MAFATSTSAFGMKPATGGTSLFGQPQQQQQPAASGFNLGNAPPLGQGQQQQQPSLFGGFGQNQQQNQQQQQQPAAGGLFGQPQQQQQPAGGGLFGQPQQQQQPAAGSLFGQPQQQQQPAAGGLFGQSQQQPAAGGLFGQPQQQQQQTGGLFGQPQQQQQPAAGGLFGQPQQQQQQQQPQQSTGGLFGQPQQQNQQQPGSNLFGGSLFGNNANNTNNQQQQQPQQNAFGGFNTQQQQQPQQQGGGSFGSTMSNPLQAQATLPAGAFGSNTGAAGGGGFGGGFGGGSSLFGNKSQQPQQQQQQQLIPQNQNLGQSAGPPPFTKSTKFNDLPDNVKSMFEQIDAHIQQRVQICKDLQQRKLGDEPTKGHDAIRQLHKELVNTATTIRNDLHVTQDLKTKVDQAVEDTIVATRIIDGFRNPQSGNTHLKDHAGFPLEYFTRVTDQMKQRLAWYKSTIEQIERKLASASSSAQSPQNISATLQAQHATFLSLASKTAAVDAELQKIKAVYTQLWRAKTGSVRDPFNDIVKSSEKSGDFGLSGLNVR